MTELTNFLLDNAIINFTKTLGRELTKSEKKVINQIRFGLNRSGEQINQHTNQKPKLELSDRSNCKYRSKRPIDLQTCPTCSGNIQIKIFSCKLHKKCCLSDKLADIKDCNTCQDFEELKE